MMRIRISLPILATLLLAGLPALAGTSEASGTVVDEEGNPIVGAVVSLNPGKGP